MNEIMNKEIRMTSKEVCELINQFRQLEGNKAELRHDSLMVKIRKEIQQSEEFGFNAQNILEVEYEDKKGEKRPCYSLDRDTIVSLTISESFVVRRNVIKYMNELEKSIKEQQGKANLLLSIYNGGQDAVLASKKLVELETLPLIETIEEQKPKVDFADKLLKTKDNILVREYAKVLSDEGFNTGERRLFKWLKDNKYLMSNNEPYQRYIDNSTFIVTVGTIDTPFGSKQTRTTKITPTGQLYLFDKITESKKED